MSYVAVLPSVYKPYTVECIDSLADEFFDHLLVVDNTFDNRGVSRSWNLGIAEMYESEADWLVIVSAAMRFGAPGGLDFIAQLADHGDAWAVEAGNDIGWKLIAFPRRTLDLIGTFDENFWPGYWEDNDFSYRVQLAQRALDQFALPLWPKVPVDASTASHGHGVKLAQVKVHPDDLLGYYRSKWGGPSSQEAFTHPFNDSSKPLSWWPEPSGDRSLLVQGQSA